MFSPELLVQTEPAPVTITAPRDPGATFESSQAHDDRGPGDDDRHQAGQDQHHQECSGHHPPPFIRAARAA
jgi:hypothetical protein